MAVIALMLPFGTLPVCAQQNAKAHQVVQQKGRAGHTTRQTNGSRTEMLQLDTLRVQYVNEDGHTCHGTIICNSAIARDLRDIFQKLYEARYPIHSIRPISEYGNDDERSMEANNTSCYCPRRTKNGGLSRHARGMAIDINPLWNPCIHISDKHAGEIEPRTARRSHVIDKDDLCYRLFIQHGFKWGGAWRSLKDYQHFEK